MKMRITIHVQTWEGQNSVQASKSVDLANPAVKPIGQFEESMVEALAEVVRVAASRHGLVPSII